VCVVEPELLLVKLLREGLADQRRLAEDALEGVILRPGLEAFQVGVHQGGVGAVAAEVVALGWEKVGGEHAHSKQKGKGEDGMLVVK
jgi:hypothetical protein